MTPQRRAAAVLALALVAGAWFAFGPRQLGGRFFYVIAQGTSMEPSLHEGDLVAVTPAADYRSGDVIAYRSRTLDRVVLHRISRTQDEHYITKGDNNRWIDTDRPQEADVLGRRSFVIPRGGKVLEALRSKWGLLAAAATALALLARRPENVARRVASRLPQHLLQAHRGRIVTGAGLAAVLLLGLGITMFVKPRPAATTTAAYTHIGRFDYSAPAPKGAVYGDGMVHAGEPIFYKLVDEVDLSFDYRLASEQEATATGIASLRVEMTDPDGWRAIFPLVSEQAFDDGHVTLTSPLDVSALVERIEKVQAATGVAHAAYDVDVKVDVRLSADTGGSAFAETFAATLPMRLEPPRLKMDPEGFGDAAQPSDPFVVSRDGAVSAVSSERSGGLPWAGLAALAAALIALAVGAAALTAETPEPPDEASRIRRRYARWIVPARAVEAAAPAKAIRLASIDALARVAESSERVIFEVKNKRGVTFFVEDRDTTYAYEARNGSSS